MHQNPALPAPAASTAEPNQPPSKDPLSTKDTPESGQDPTAAYRHHRGLIRLGEFLMAGGTIIIVTHWIAHLAPVGQGPSLTLDIYARYPPEDS